MAKPRRCFLYADKRVEASKFLIEGGKPEVGVTTAVKGEKYLNDAVNEIIQAKENGQDVSYIESKVKTSIAAHLQLLEQLQQHSPEMFAALKEAIDINKSTTTLLPQ